MTGVGKLHIISPVIDYSGRYLAGIDPAGPEKGTIRLYSLKNLRPLVSSKLKGMPKAIIVMPNKLYLLVELCPAPYPGIPSYRCEVYAISSGELALESTSDIPDKAWRGRWSGMNLTMLLQDVDATTGDMCFFAWYDWPKRESHGLVHNVVTGETQLLASKMTGILFLSPDIFDSALDALEAKDAKKLKAATKGVGVE